MTLSPRERAERYVGAALDSICAELASTTGQRNDALNNAALQAGGFVGAGVVTQDEATERLLAACELNGYLRADGRSQAMATIRSGLRAGMRTPREMPDGSERQPTRVVARARDPEPAYPDRGDIARTWSKGQPVASEVSLAGWLERVRRINPSEVDRSQLARCLPAGAGYPSCVFTRADAQRSMPAKGYRLAVPLYDVAGAMRSLLFRRQGVPGDQAPKSMAAQGQRRGLVMACRIALWMLRRGEWPRDWRGEPRLLIAEGEMDFLRAATWWGPRRDRPATIGIVQGSWSDALTARIPSGTTIVIATDADPAGDAYAQKIVAMCADRARRKELFLERLRPEVDERKAV